MSINSIRYLVISFAQILVIGECACVENKQPGQTRFIAPDRFIAPSPPPCTPTQKNTEELEAVGSVLGRRTRYLTVGPWGLLDKGQLSLGIVSNVRAPSACSTQASDWLAGEMRHV